MYVTSFSVSTNKIKSLNTNCQLVAHLQFTSFRWTFYTPRSNFFIPFEKFLSFYSYSSFSFMPMTTLESVSCPHNLDTPNAKLNPNTLHSFLQLIVPQSRTNHTKSGLSIQLNLQAPSILKKYEDFPNFPYRPHFFIVKAAIQNEPASFQSNRKTRRGMSCTNDVECPNSRLKHG